MAELQHAYDFVVVGAGTAGCVVAALSENSDVSVPLLEAKPMDRHPFIHSPATVGAAIGTPAINSPFMTTPRAHLNGRRLRAQRACHR